VKALLIRLTALVLTLAAAVATFILASALRLGFWPPAMLALVAFFVCGFGLLRLTKRMTPGASTPVVRWLLGGALAYAIIAQLTIGRVPSRTLESPQSSASTMYWTLSDGSRIAYEKAAASGAQRGAPIIVLHDGPGVPLLPFLQAVGRRPLDFAGAIGHDVVYYDQIGAGLSDRIDLAKADPYTVARHVRDLEEIRNVLQAPKLILYGAGWGATLAAQYLLQHADRVEKVVLESPGPLWSPAWPELIPPSARARMTDVEATALAALQRPPLRLVLGRVMADLSIPAAHSFISDWEADQWWTRTTEESWRLGQPNLTCHSDPARGVPPPVGLGFFANSYTLVDAAKLPDPREPLKQVPTDVLVIRGSCDYIDWHVSNEYLKVLPRARYVAIPAAGHFVWLEQPGLFAEVVSAFLRGEPVPLEAYNSAR